MRLSLGRSALRLVVCRCADLPADSLFNFSKGRSLATERTFFQLKLTTYGNNNIKSDNPLLLYGGFLQLFLV